MFRGRICSRRPFVEGSFVCSGQLCRSSIPSGGARRDRTDDLMLAKHALSQLSYGPVPEDECFKLDEKHMRSIKVVGLGRLELPTSRLSSARSNQLSYKPPTQGAARAHRPDADASHKRSPWRVFVREERETKTAKSRQWSSTGLATCWPLMFQKRFDKSELLKNHP